MTQSQPIEFTQGANRTPSAPRPHNPKEQQGESSVQRKSTIIRIPRRKQTDPATPILTVEQIDVDSLDEATRVSIPTARIKGEETDADKFTDDMLNSQKDPDTRIDSRNHKESLEAKKVTDYMVVDEEVEEESAEAALIRRKGKGSLEIKDTSITITSRSPRTITDSLSLDKKNFRN
ncbi:hypothetical protein Tco_0895410 [Tanacetum coccineum]|uniref:Uncharacterized protein n=1 Tax=Tanacetum coccineum TaxID=301880 RepID=A0ABQ5CH36_9ASTR